MQKSDFCDETVQTNDGIRNVFITYFGGRKFDELRLSTFNCV